MTDAIPTVKVVAWRYQPGAPLHPTVRPGLPGCDKPLPCERCGLSVHGELLGYRFIMNPGEWLVAIEDRIALVMPDNMFQRIRGRSVVGPDGVLVDEGPTAAAIAERDSLRAAMATDAERELRRVTGDDDDDLDALLEAT